MSGRIERRLSTPALLAFAAPSIAYTALQLALTVQLPRYFASHVGMELAAVGLTFALVRAIDIPLDPLLGLAMDRTRTRFGRYRVWALAGAPVLMAALYVMMRPPAPLGVASLTAVLLVMFLGYSAILLAQLAWAGALARDYQERSRVFAAITGLGVAGAVAVLVVPVVMGRLGRNDAEGVEAMIWCVIAAAPLCALLMARTPEPITPDHAHAFNLANYATLLTRPNVLRLLGSDLFIQLGPGWMASLYLYNFTTVRGFSTITANLLLLVYIAAGFAGAPMVSALAARINKHRALMACTTLFALCLLAMPLMPKGSVAVATPLMFIAGIAFSGFSVMLRALAADIADEVRLDWGREAMGLIFALTNATTKLAVACALFLTFNVLAWVGFDPREGAVNTAHALLGLDIAFLAGPTVFVTLGGLCFVGYRLDRTRHAEIRSQLDARDREHRRAGP